MGAQCNAIAPAPPRSTTKPKVCSQSKTNKVGPSITDGENALHCQIVKEHVPNTEAIPDADRALLNVVQRMVGEGLHTAIAASAGFGIVGDTLVRSRTALLMLLPHAQKICESS